MKHFDWSRAHPRGEAFNLWLQMNQSNPVSEDEFVAVYRQLALPCKKHHKAPSRARASYRYLRSEFGFFPGA